ncbi:MAG: alpha/beta hydrolase [Nitrospiraceae bacterium]
MKGVATLRFDFFGHGESDGPFRVLTTTIGVDQALAALVLATRQGYRRLALVGSSFGGLVSILAAAEWAIRKQSPPDRDAAALLSCTKMSGGGFRRGTPVGTQRDRHGGMAPHGSIPDLHGPEDSARLCVLRRLPEPNRLRTGEKYSDITIIVQGDCDEYVPAPQSQRLHDALPGSKRLEMLPGADHQFTKSPDFQRMYSA